MTEPRRGAVGGDDGGQGQELAPEIGGGRTLATGDPSAEVREQDPGVDPDQRFEGRRSRRRMVDAGRRREGIDQRLPGGSIATGPSRRYQPEGAPHDGVAFDGG